MAAASKRQEIAATVEDDLDEDYGPKLIGKLEVRFLFKKNKFQLNFNTDFV